MVGNPVEFTALFSKIMVSISSPSSEGGGDNTIVMEMNLDGSFH